MIVPTANYPTSRDYRQLWELAHTAAVVCIVDMDHGKPDTCRDIARTVHSPEWSPELVQVGSRGIGHVWAESLEAFIAGCEQCNLEWLVPPAAQPALPVAPAGGLVEMVMELREKFEQPRPLGAAMTTPLSPAAQAVKDAALYALGPRSRIAAALRAAADQVVPEEPENEDFDGDNHDDKAEWLQWSQRTHTRRELLAIAAELEGLP